MAALDTLPKEVLHDIVSYLSPDFPDLRNCSLVCRALWAVATSVLYNDIDFEIDKRYDRQADEKNERRQLRLLRSLAKNPKLGAVVRTFKNCPVSFFAKSYDATMDDDSSVIIGAAQNMKFLSKAFFTPNPLAAHIIANLKSYSQLVDLHVCGLLPGEHIWSKAPVSLKSLKWDMPAGRRGADQNPWDTAQLLINIVGATCPGLEFLDISSVEMRHTNSLFNLPAVPPERAEQYRQANASASIKLTHLRYFGFSYKQSPNHQSGIEAAFLGFIGRHGQSLKSISIPISCGPWNKEKLNFILKVCGFLPELKDLTLVETQTGQRGQMMSGYDFFHALTTALASPKFSIESFSVADIGVPFSPAIGKLFSSWTSLKCLRLGDADNDRNPSPYGNDGRLDFHMYKPEILKFIKALPPSLEELYIEINGEGLWCDEDEDFDPVCNLGIPIFDSLRRLHTCDIHAWISNCDGGLGRLPEKCVFYRRLPNQSQTTPGTQESKIKNIWTSRMDSMYQESGAVITTECVEVELADDEGVWEGRDADEVWLDGYTFDGKHGTTVRGRPADKPDYPWPFWENKVASYSMFRKRY